MRREEVRILLDENVPYEAVAWLRARLPLARTEHVYDLGFASKPDDSLHRWACDRGAIIVTYDADLADLRRFPVGSRCGVVRLRVEPTTEEETCSALDRLLCELDVRSLLGKLVIIDHRRVRLIG